MAEGQSHEASFAATHKYVTITCEQKEFVRKLEVLAYECSNLWPPLMDGNIFEFLAENTNATPVECEVIARDLKQRLKNPTLEPKLHFFKENTDNKLAVFVFAQESSLENMMDHCLVEIRIIPRRLQPAAPR